ncbi:MAG: hypothetical protein LBV26_02640 [Bacteroidales bacterium]|nr:hypothetical protein [Bacteroidales bacterium]
MQCCGRLASVDATFAKRFSILASVDATFTQWCRRLASVDATFAQCCSILASADATACLNNSLPATNMKFRAFAPTYY